MPATRRSTVRLAMAGTVAGQDADKCGVSRAGSLNGRGKSSWPAPVPAIRRGTVPLAESHAGSLTGRDTSSWPAR